MPLNQVNKFRKRIERLGKYITVLLNPTLPMSRDNFQLFVIEGGTRLEWIEKRIRKLTRDYTIFQGHEGSNRYFRLYYGFISNMVMCASEEFQGILERESN